MKYSKEILEQVKKGEAKEDVLIMNIMASNSLHEIVGFVVDALMKEPTSSAPITISKEEYERITSLFRIRGYKVNEDGEMVAESRGRKPRNIHDEKSSLPFGD